MSKLYTRYTKAFHTIYIIFLFQSYIFDTIIYEQSIRQYTIICVIIYFIWLYLILCILNILICDFYNFSFFIRPKRVLERAGAGQPRRRNLPTRRKIRRKTETSKLKITLLYSLSNYLYCEFLKGLYGQCNLCEWLLLGYLCVPVTL